MAALIASGNWLASCRRSASLLGGNSWTLFDHADPGKKASSLYLGITCQCMWGTILPKAAIFTLSGCITCLIASSTAKTSDMRCSRSPWLRSVISDAWRLQITRQKPGRSGSFTKMTRQSSPRQINWPSSGPSSSLQSTQLVMGTM